MSPAALSGAKGKHWQAVVTIIIGNNIIVLLLTIMIILGDAKALRIAACVFPNVTNDDICLFREGLSGWYVITAFMCHGYSLFARCVSEKCPEGVKSTEMLFCKSASYPSSSPIPLDNFCFLVVFLVLYQVWFPQLKWDHHAFCWGTGLFFLTMVVAEALILRGVVGVSLSVVIQTILYFLAYLGLYLFMSWLHRYKLNVFVNTSGLNAGHRTDAGLDGSETEDTVDSVTGSIHVGVIHRFPGPNTVRN